MDKRTELLTDQELADALQSAIWRANRLADHALARACKYAETLDAAGPVVVEVSHMSSALRAAHGHATAAALAMPGVAPAFGDK